MPLKLVRPTVLSMIGPNRAAAFNRSRGRECILNARTAAVRTKRGSSHLLKNPERRDERKSIAGQLGERRSRLALSSDSAPALAAHWRVSDFVALTKPRVMMLAIFTALVGLSRAPVVDWIRYPTLVAVLAIAAGAAAAGVLNMWYDADIDAVMVRHRDAANSPGQDFPVRGAWPWPVARRFGRGGSGFGDQPHGGSTAQAPSSSILSSTRRG